MNKTHEVITNHILSALDQEIIPWHRPWKLTASDQRNGFSGKPYNGINILMTEITSALKGYSDLRWYTFNQVRELQKRDKFKEIRVRRGEKSTPIIFYKTWEEEDKDTGETKTRRFLQYSNVFNREQIDNWPPEEVREPEREITLNIEAEKIVEGYSDAPPIKFVKQNRAFYRPSTDEITLPLREQFEGDQEFYSTLFHEFGHSTGHESRLDRNLNKVDRLDDHRTEYSREELVAEFCATFLCSEAGIEQTLDNSTAYIQGWAANLKQHPEWIISATRDGQKAAKYILGISEEEKA